MSKEIIPAEAFARADKSIAGTPGMADTVARSRQWETYCAEHNWSKDEKPDDDPKLAELYEAYREHSLSRLLLSLPEMQWGQYSRDNELEMTAPPLNHPEELLNYIEWVISQQKIAYEWLEKGDTHSFVEQMSQLPILEDVLRRGAKGLRGKANKSASHIGYTSAPDLKIFASKMRPYQSDPANERREHVSRIFPSWLVRNRKTGKFYTPSLRTIANKLTQARNAGLLPGVRLKKKKGAPK